MFGAAGCSQQATSERENPQAPSGARAAAAVPSTDVRQRGSAAALAGQGEADASPTIVFLGDSLTAGLGVAQDLAFPSLVEERLVSEGVPVHTINAGVSGDTTAGGLSRLDWLLRQKPDVVVVELGANDGLRALPLGEVRTNLREIVTRAKASGAKVLLVGMLIPTNYGPSYSTGFAKIYPALAKELKVPLVPFLLDGVAGRPDLNQEDGIHPTAEGHRRLAENVLPYLREMLGGSPGS